MTSWIENSSRRCACVRILHKISDVAGRVYPKPWRVIRAVVDIEILRPSPKVVVADGPLLRPRSVKDDLGFVVSRPVGVVKIHLGRRD